MAEETHKRMTDKINDKKWTVVFTLNNLLYSKKKKWYTDIAQLKFFVYNKSSEMSCLTLKNLHNKNIRV